MTILTIQLSDKDYERLQNTAQQAGKSVQDIVQDWIAELPAADLPIDLTQDPIYLFDGYDSDAPEDLSSNLDKYLYSPSAPTVQ